MVFIHPSLAAQPPPTALGRRFTELIGSVLQGISEHAGRTRFQPDPGLPQIWRYVARLLSRFLALLVKVEAGTLRPPRRRHPATAEAPAPAVDPAAPDPPPHPPPDPPPDPPPWPGPPLRPLRPLPPPRLPGEFAWLLRRVPPSPTVSNPVAYGHACLHLLLADPEVVALVAAAPQAGRLLRPLCRALGVAIPEYLRLPPRPGQAARAAARAAARQAARAEARAARLAARDAARAEAAWGRRFRRSLGLPARAPRDALPLKVIRAPPARPPPARPPPKRD